MDEITPFFKKLSSIATPDEISDDEFELLAFFVVRLYSKTFNTKEVKMLFSRKDGFCFPGITKSRTSHVPKEHYGNMSSEQSFNLKRGDTLCVKT